MNIEKLPNSLLNGKFLHCRPVEDGPIVVAQILPSQGELSTAIVCGARQPRSECALRIKFKGKDRHCQYYRGDGFGYQIIGLGMDEKSDRGYRST